MLSRSAAPEVQKRILVVDADQKFWELPARLLIAKGCLVHRISHLSEAPPRWPPHLYDLVLIATPDAANLEVAQFCDALHRVQAQVHIALLAPAQTSSPAWPIIIKDKPAAELTDSITRLLES
jgi:CheY-like chemotaxis protein